MLPEHEAGTSNSRDAGASPPGSARAPSTLAAVLACVSPGGYMAVGPHTLAACIALSGADVPVPSAIAIAFQKYDRAPAVRAFLNFARRPENAA